MRSSCQNFSEQHKQQAEEVAGVVLAEVPEQLGVAVQAEELADQLDGDDLAVGQQRPGPLWRRRSRSAARSSSSTQQKTARRTSPRDMVALRGTSPL